MEPTNSIHSVDGPSPTQNVQDGCKDRPFLQDLLPTHVHEPTEASPQIPDNAIILTFENHERLMRAAEERGMTPAQLVSEAIEAILSNRLRRRPGPPKGRSLKPPKEGAWTPLILRAEMNRTGINAAKLSKLLGVSHTCIQKWLKKGIPNQREDMLNTIFEKSKF